MNNKFDVREYVDKNFSEEIVKSYEKDFGLNGLDKLWGCKNYIEVEELLNGYRDEKDEWMFR